MLRKLAQIAAWLDDRGLRSEADLVSDVLIRCAIDQSFEEDDSDGPEVKEFNTPFYYPEQEPLYAASPEYLDHMAKHNPSGHEWWRGMLESKGMGDGVDPSDHKYQVHLNGEPIHLPRGLKSGLSSEDIPRFRVSDDDLANSAAETQRFHHDVTNGGKNQAFFRGQYLNGSQEPPKSPEDKERMRQQRLMYFSDPLKDIANKSFDRRMEEYNDAQKRGVDKSEMPRRPGGLRPSESPFGAFDADVLRKAIDPRFMDDAARDNLQQRPFEDVVGDAWRNYKPRFQGMGRALRDKDESGRPIPHLKFRTSR